MYPIIIAAGIVLIAVTLIISIGYVKAPPDQAFIISGLKKEPRIISGGSGQSRLCMLLLGRVHVGEVQASVWPEEMRRLCAEKNITLL